jgi:hypothetical protein
LHTFCAKIGTSWLKTAYCKHSLKAYVLKISPEFFFLLQGQHPLVIKETSAALKLNPKYVKALHRRSKSYKATGFLEEALEDITAVCILEQFSSPSSVQLADDILKELGAKEGQRLLSARVPPVNPSAHTIDAYIRGFYNCPVAKIKRNNIHIDDG